VVEFSSAGRPARVYWHHGDNEALPAPGLDPFAEEMRYFVECCRAGRTPERCPPRASALAVAVARVMVDARERKGDKTQCEFLRNWKSA
jgi:hypothetical protein